VPASEWERLVGPVTLSRRPQVLFAEEDLEQARRQLVLYGRDGLPVISRDGQLRGWLTRADVLRALATRLSSSEEEIEEGAVAAEFAVDNPSAAARRPTTPLEGYEILELRIFADSPARGRRVSEVDWPPGSIVVAVTQGREIHAARPDLELRQGERVIALAPTAGAGDSERQGAAAAAADRALARNRGAAQPPPNPEGVVGASPSADDHRKDRY
jgi:CIC family chloride channel protein